MNREFLDRNLDSASAIFMEDAENAEAVVKSQLAVAKCLSSAIDKSFIDRAKYRIRLREGKTNVYKYQMSDIYVEEMAPRKAKEEEDNWLFASNEDNKTLNLQVSNAETEETIPIGGDETAKVLTLAFSLIGASYEKI